jgi:26S proteasome non-ATPase regulatory subunit 10
MAAAMDVDRAGGGERRPSEKELFRAAESGEAAAFSSLATADLSLRNEDGRSLLHVAAAAGHPQARKGAFYSLVKTGFRVFDGFAVFPWV